MPSMGEPKHMPLLSETKATKAPPPPRTTTNTPTDHQQTVAPRTIIGIKAETSSSDPNTLPAAGRFRRARPPPQPQQPCRS